MNAKDCADCLKRTVHGNSFCAQAYVIYVLNKDKALYKNFLEDSKRQGLEIKEIYILTGNDYKDRVIIAGVLHAIEALLWLKVPVSDILAEFYNKK